MSAWLRRLEDCCINLGLSMAELSRRCHGQIDRRDMAELVVAMEETLQLDDIKTRRTA